ncbi:GTP-binding protein [Halobacteria archaeon AArc-dxtr1]|nr:GTP-binding protein [Halobacteria archaeon AArc-dxtr1]
MTVPVTVLSGALGAGKTTTLNHVLTADHDAEIAVVVNDMGEVNVDADLVERRVTDDGEVVELSNGCICCGIHGEFERAIVDLARSESFEYLLVEPSGISEPAPVARQFVHGHAGAFYDLHSVATVVDARQFHDAFAGGVVSRHGADDGDRPLSDLIAAGVEFCDTIVLNKVDLVDQTERQEAIDLLRTVQPDAELLTAEFGHVEPEALLAPDARFDLESVSTSASWKRALEHHREHDHDDGHPNHEADEHHHSTDDDDHSHAHPPEEYGVESFLYEARRPMHPKRLHETFAELPTSVVRAKGFLHVAGRPDHALTLSLSGPEAHIEVVGRWIASLSTDRQERYQDDEAIDWDEQYGDRKTELVVIGREMDIDDINARLDDCRCTEMELEDQATMENPFPAREGETLQL